MNNNTFVGLAVVLLLACAGSPTTQQTKAPPEVWQQAKTSGIVRVIVGLNVPWQPEGKLSQQERLAQRQAIAAIQNELVAELAGTNYRVSGQPRFTPSIGVEVGPDALAVLERSTRVAKITEDLPDRPITDPR